MNWRHYLVLFLIGLLVPFGAELAKGNGFNEPYLWNYLDDPQGLPHPSHTYWMPLASIVSAVGMWVTGQITYASGRIPFILLSACVPLLTATLAFEVSLNRMLAIVSGLLSIFSLYYAPFMPVPDNYALYMLLGGAFLLLAPRKQKWIPIALGAFAGLMTLARSDGLLWLGLAGLTVMWKYANKEEGTKNSFNEWVKMIVPAGLLALLGYFLVMGGWHYRSYTLFDSFMTPGGGRLLWLENYNQTFSYPADSLTREGFLNAGWDAAMDVRFKALGSNLGNMFAAQGGIFLFPFILIGLWELRKELRARIAVTGWLILFFIMTLIFPFAGARGSFFHAGAAFQPLWWVDVPVGLNVVIAFARKRGLFADNAYVVFQGMLVILAIFMTYFLVDLRVLGEWATEDGVYASVEQIFIDNGISPDVGVIVRNPPGYYISSGRPAIALPYGDESVILQVAERYGAGLLILESTGTFDWIQDLYDNPKDTDFFIYLGEVDDAKLYRIK